MIYIIGLILSLAAGYLVIRRWIGSTLNPVLHLLLGLLLGLCLDSTAAFYAHVLLGLFNRWIPVGLIVLMILFLSFQLYKEMKPSKKKKKNDIKWTPSHGWAMAGLGVLSVPLMMSACHYPLGGWDAWSCWNLKAKFIFLGQGNWKDMLEPGLWRSNTHYPLLWPLLNVWFWDLGGAFDQAVPMFNSVLFALLTAAMLIFGLWELTGRFWSSLLAAIIITALPFGVTLYISQYSDSWLGLLLLSSFTCLLLAEKYNLPRLKILSMVFLGIMSFTKNEGLAASGITALLVLWHERRHKKELKALIAAYLLAALPTIIFTLFMAPKNEAFVNGLISGDKPTSLSRIAVILAYPWVEFISAKWNGLWFLVLGATVLSGKKLWRGTPGLIAASLGLYLAVVGAYYAVNTFFEINWWLSTTLSRILFAMVPTIALWVGLGF